MKIEIENTVIVAINRKETKKNHRNKSSVAGDNCRYARFL